MNRRIFFFFYLFLQEMSLAQRFYARAGGKSDARSRCMPKMILIPKKLKKYIAKISRRLENIKLKKSNSSGIVEKGR